MDMKKRFVRLFASQLGSGKKFIKKFSFVDADEFTLGENELLVGVNPVSEEFAEESLYDMDGVETKAGVLRIFDYALRYNNDHIQYAAPEIISIICHCWGKDSPYSHDDLYELRQAIYTDSPLPIEVPDALAFLDDKLLAIGFANSRKRIEWKNKNTRGKGINEELGSETLIVSLVPFKMSLADFIMEYSAGHNWGTEDINVDEIKRHFHNSNIFYDATTLAANRIIVFTGPRGVEEILEEETFVLNSEDADPDPERIVFTSDRDGSRIVISRSRGSYEVVDIYNPNSRNE